MPDLARPPEHPPQTRPPWLGLSTHAPAELATLSEFESRYDGVVPEPLREAARRLAAAEQWRGRAAEFCTHSGNDLWLAAARRHLDHERARVKMAARHRFEFRRMARAADARALCLQPDGGLRDRVAAYRQARETVSRLEAMRAAIAAGALSPDPVTIFRRFMAGRHPLVPDFALRPGAAE